MFLNLRPKAVNWMNRSDEVFELKNIDGVVADWAEERGLPAHPSEAEVSQLLEANRGSERACRLAARRLLYISALFLCPPARDSHLSSPKIHKKM